MLVAERIRTLCSIRAANVMLKTPGAQTLRQLAASPS